MGGGVGGGWGWKVGVLGQGATQGGLGVLGRGEGGTQGGEGRGLALYRFQLLLSVAADVFPSCPFRAASLDTVPLTHSVTGLLPLTPCLESPTDTLCR
jgi:hypothetical protein